MPHGFDQRKAIPGIGKGEYGVRRAELCVSIIGHRQYPLHPADGFCGVVRDLAFQALRILERSLAVSRHLRGGDHKMDVVRIVAVAIDVQRFHPLHRPLVGSHRLLVGFRRIGIASNAVIKVRRHVNNVAGAGHQRGQLVRIGLGALGMPGGLGEMNVQMDCPRVV